MRTTFLLCFLGLLGCSGEDAASQPNGSGGSSGASTGGAGAGSSGAAGASGGQAGAATGGNAGNGASAGSGGNTVGMFVAQGHMGRTLRSCDDGETWIDDKSDDAAAKCFSGSVDCDHNAGAANGIVFHQGAFYATYGWGTPGGIRKSADGVQWEEVLTGTTFGGIAASPSLLVAAAREPQTSADQGGTWSKQASLSIGNIWNIREAAFSGGADGRFVMAGNDGADRVIAVSADGKNFDAPSFPGDCDVSFYRSGGIAAGAGAIVISDGGAKACRSTDAGASWSTVDIGSDFDSQLLHDGKQFVAYKTGTRLSSVDGAVWQSTPTVPGSLSLGVIAVSDQGTYVGVRGGWDTWYEKQRFYRSADGIAWQELPAGSFSGGHPIIHMAFGRVPAALCP
ncbi:MAG: hypothetical protein R3B13_02640 [Polyangiaceae bacterium]